jgi:putative addiction module component (TIGR02574 family)
LSRSIEAIEQEIVALPEGQRLALLQNLIAHLDAPFDQDIEDSWNDEALRRYRELKSGSSSPVPLDEVKAKARRLIL